MKFLEHMKLTELTEAMVMINSTINTTMSGKWQNSARLWCKRILKDNNRITIEVDLRARMRDSISRNGVLMKD